ncbi:MULTISPECIES: hypothetical protein [Burkholderia]|uniref:hypothetical protein n=1 Tax=Burkholderia TaxID=32008 RepID=UPI0011B27922|nr:MULTISPECIES: hypothetical protein [Burkholderia]MBG0863122.1 hypothetical protein [Burkholderia sp. 9779_493]MBU9297525.1 hypothetical protein [Burkholderia multivorans]MBU9308873.1 hypothetical protein [Burkholderia multivorans]MBU9403515.1 hypothetical protein [Burkholderia multivorans]MCO1460591.1 hypothetical protein [Burkholderia multivorans]
MEEIEPTTEARADQIAANPVSDDTSAASTQDAQPGTTGVPVVENSFARVHPTIGLRTATDKLNRAAPIIDVQTEITVCFADGTMCRTSVAHSRHDAGTNAERIAAALSQVTVESAIRCIAN